MRIIFEDGEILDLKKVEKIIIESTDEVKDIEFLKEESNE